jgi:hypothetical protein
MNASLVRCAITLAIVATASGPQTAVAAMFFDVDKKGHVVSATADFSAAGDVLTVTIANTTPSTLGVQDLLDSIDFSLNGLTPTLTSVTGVLRTIDVDGAFTDGSNTDDLSWSLKSLGGDRWQINSGPGAKQAIVGPATDGDYAGASRSVRGNPGHSPYIAEMIVAELNVPGLSSAEMPVVVVSGFGFNGASAVSITADGPLEVPEPSARIMLIFFATVGTIAMRALRPLG